MKYFRIFPANKRYDSPLSNLLGIRTEVVGEIIWQKMLVKNWQIYPDQLTATDQIR